MAEACYVRQFLPASFKGFPFEAMDAGSEHGRRGFLAEFPFGEDTADVDLGRKARKYAVRARFVTNDHVAQANAFIAVIESPGPGALVHPTRGVAQVRCENARVQDDLLEGYGITIVELEFVESNDASLGIGLGNLYGTPIVGFVGNVAAQFVAAYDPTSAPFYEVPAILGATVASLNALSSALTESLGIAPDANAWAQVSALNRMGAAPENNYDPVAVSSAVQAGFAAIDRYASTPDAKYAAFKSVANTASKVSALASTAGAASQNAVYASVRLTAAAYMARAASQITPETMSEAFGWIADIGGLLQQEQDAAQVACSSDFYLIIRAFKTSALAALTYSAYNAPVRIVYSFHGPIASHVAAYRIYGDSTRFRDIETANPNMPCFAMGPDLIATKVAA